MYRNLYIQKGQIQKKQLKDANMHGQISITNIFIELQKAMYTVTVYKKTNSNTFDHFDFLLMMWNGKKKSINMMNDKSEYILL